MPFRLSFNAKFFLVSWHRLGRCRCKRRNRPGGHQIYFFFFCKSLSLSLLMFLWQGPIAPLESSGDKESAKAAWGWKSLQRKISVCQSNFSFTGYIGQVSTLPVVPIALVAETVRKEALRHAICLHILCSECQTPRNYRDRNHWLHQKRYLLMMWTLRCACPRVGVS